MVIDERECRKETVAEVARQIMIALSLIHI